MIKHVYIFIRRKNNYSYGFESLVVLGINIKVINAFNHLYGIFLLNIVLFFFNDSVIPFECKDWDRLMLYRCLHSPSPLSLETSHWRKSSNQSQSSLLTSYSFPCSMMRVSAYPWVFYCREIICFTLIWILSFKLVWTEYIWNQVYHLWN